jgi:hypothetical protein
LDKFTIASKPVLVSHIHAGVFVPVNSRDGAIEDYSFIASSNPSLRLTYWDQKSYLCELMISETPPPGYVHADESEQNLKDNEQKSKKRKAETTVVSSAKKSAPSHLQHWNNRQAELYGNKPAKKEEPEPEPLEVKKPKSVESVLSYTDPTRNCCYLCSRQFKSPAEANKHERLSQLHRDGLKNEELRAKGLIKLQKVGISPRYIILPESMGDDTGEYRDRAKERRHAFGQPKKPAKKQPNSPEKQDDDESGNQPRASKGAALLGKMGWSEGQGLGAQGTGMKAPIATDLYAEGVGLGAVGGKIGDAVEEAEKRTQNSYGAFLEKTRDGARDRYENMKEH